MVEVISFDNEAEIYKYSLSCNIARGTLIEVHIADLHFTAFDPKTQYEILKEQFLDEIYKLPRLDIVSIDGDLFDHKVLSSSDGAYYATMFISNLVDICRQKNATLVIVHGTWSHDANQLKLFYHYMQDKTVDVRIVTNVQFEYIKGAKILCIPELYGLDESIYRNFLFYSGHYDSVFMHGTIKGSVYGDNSGNAKLFSIEDFDNCNGPILSGHVHKPGCFNDYMYYCGSPYCWSFADDHKKGYLIVSHNLDTGSHYCHFNEITSFKYATIELDSIIDEDPRIVIEYINKMKIEKHIDFIKVRFDVPISGMNKTIINNYYRTVNDTEVEFLDIEKEAARRREQEISNQLNEYSYILDNKLSSEEIFCNYINDQKGFKFITVDKLLELLNNEI